jgi:hypothetical protein
MKGRAQAEAPRIPGRVSNNILIAIPVHIDEQQPPQIVLAVHCTIVAEGDCLSLYSASKSSCP